jgi:hypothetical protein
MRIRASYAGLINIILGILIITSTLMSGPYAFGNKWLGVIVLVAVGGVNVLLGVWILIRRSGR